MNSPCKFFSLLLAVSALTSCHSETETIIPQGTPLSFSVHTASIDTRSIVENTLPDGHSIGFTLVDATGTTYDNITYNNIKTTASAGAASQTWTPAGNMLLSSTKGTLYGYYPYNGDVTDITSVPVVAGDTDYMYATPVTGLCESNYEAEVTMQHALAVIRLNIVRGTYSGTGAVTAVSIQGDNVATSGKLNALTGALSGQAGEGTALSHTSSFTLSTAGQTEDFIFVPLTSSSAAPVFTATIDGDDYTVTVTEAVAFQQNTIYTYTLTVDDEASSTALSVVHHDWQIMDDKLF